MIDVISDKTELVDIVDFCGVVGEKDLVVVIDDVVTVEVVVVRFFISTSLVDVTADVIAVVASFDVEDDVVSVEVDIVEMVDKEPVLMLGCSS